MELTSITSNHVIVDLAVWQVAWLAQALRAAESICFGGMGSDAIQVVTDKADDPMQRAAMTGYLYAQMAATFEAAGAG